MKKLILTLIILIISVSTVLIVITMNASLKLNTPEKPPVLQNVQDFSLCYLSEQGLKYNPMLPYINEMEPFSMDLSTAVFGQGSKVELLFDDPELNNMKYEILDPLMNEVLSSGNVTEGSFTLPSLSKDIPYILKLTNTRSNQFIYYYQQFYIKDTVPNNLIKTLLGVHGTLFDGSKHYDKYIQGRGEGGTFYEATQDASPKVLLWKTETSLVEMNEPIPVITGFDIISGRYDVDIDFTVANRVDYVFEYWDFTEHFQSIPTSDGIKITSFKRHGNRKNEPYFDEDVKKWVIDEGMNQLAKGVLKSEKGPYNAFVYKNELYLLDKTDNTLRKVFGFDQLDSDYVMDEDNHHGIKLLNLDDDGNLKYIVYGYMADGPLAGNNGISFNYYNQSKRSNENQFFISTPYTYKTMAYGLNQTSFYNVEQEQFYFTLDDNVFQFDFKEKTFNNVMNISGYVTYLEGGAFYLIDNKSKENGGIQLANMSSSAFETNLLMYENKGVQIVGATNGNLLLGTYDIVNTYEYLDGNVFYPFDHLLVVDYSGEVISDIIPEAGTFFGDVQIDQALGQVQASIVQFYKKISPIPSMSKMGYEKIKEKNIYQFDKSKETSIEPIIISDEVDGIHRMLVNYESVSLNEVLMPLAKENLSKLVVFTDEKIHAT
ncbi:MAG: hypothetical protein H7X94_10155, partial [Vallitaleaceae bacterium]|nr:hypothetical protein [Vallitaleaceae bacterium]